MRFDVVIQGGMVVDGSGAPPLRADVGIVGERIAVVDAIVGAEAAMVVEATGMVVAPGFVDVHVHSEIERLGGPDRYSGIRQGVTTELMAPDGFAWTPLPPPYSEQVRAYLQVFYRDVPLSWEWPTLDAYLALFPGHIPGNLALQAPHLPAKVSAMGWQTRPARGEEFEKMQRFLQTWFEAGAVSLSAGLEYQPGAYSTTDELIALAHFAARYDAVYVPHQRGYWAQLRQGSAETFRIAREANIPVHISHLAVDEEAERLLAEAVEAGLDVSFDMYPYAASCTHLMMMLPEWAQAGGHEAAMDRLRDLAQRAALREETAERIARRGVITLASVPEEPSLEGATLGSLAAEAGMAEVDYLIELLLTHGGRVLATYHWPASLDREAILRRTVSHPLYIGGSDGLFPGSRPHPRGFGTFPRIVGEYVRQGTLRLEEAVHKVSGRPAQRFGLKDRGLLRSGMAADVVVFEPQTLADRSTWEAPRTPPAGMREVFVNGVQVVRAGEPTGALPGKLLRRG